MKAAMVAMVISFLIQMMVTVDVVLRQMLLQIQLQINILTYTEPMVSMEPLDGLPFTKVLLVLFQELHSSRDSMITQSQIPLDQ